MLREMKFEWVSDKSEEREWAGPCSDTVLLLTV